MGEDVSKVAAEIVETLRSPDLRLAIVFADWQLDSARLAHDLTRGLAPAPVIGGTTIGVIADGAPRFGTPAAVGIGFYGDWIRVGVGVAHELSASALPRSRDAVQQALSALRRTNETLDPERHVGVTIFDGKCGAEESFCIGSAVAAPQIRFVGTAVATEMASERRPFVFVDGHARTDSAVVVVIESQIPFHAVTSAHLMPTTIKTVVTSVASGGRVISELDGRPAAQRFRELIESLGDQIDPKTPSEYSFARYVDNTPYVRSLTHVDDRGIHLASGVEPGHVLRVMRPGDLIGTTQRDLALAAERVGGTMSAFLAFSCIARHWEAAARGITSDLADAYAMYPTVGTWSFGEQSGMLLVNHTLTGLALGEPSESSARGSARWRVASHQAGEP